MEPGPESGTESNSPALSNEALGIEQSSSSNPSNPAPTSSSASAPPIIFETAQKTDASNLNDDHITAPQNGSAILKNETTTQTPSNSGSPRPVSSSERIRSASSAPGNPQMTGGKAPGESCSRKIKNLFRYCRLSRPALTQSPIEWISFLLLPRTLVPFLLLTVALTGTITALIILSRTGDGIANVDDNSVAISSFQVGLGLAWTTLPAFLFSLYGLWFAAIVFACADRQPYVELYRQGDGAPPEQSIRLDYRADSYKKIYVAWKRKHLVLLIGFLLSLILTTLHTSLAAHLLAAATVIIQHPSSVALDTTFNESGFTYQSDLVPVYDIVSSTLVFGGAPPAWTTSKYCLPSFTDPTIPGAPIGGGNFSVEALAYSANLSCAILSQSQYQLTYVDAQWHFEGSDRGCSLSRDIFPAELGSQNFSIYAQSFANVSCSLDAGQSRLVLVTAKTANSSSNTLSNVTAISCETAYWNSSGLLNVNIDLDHSSTPKILGYVETGGTIISNPTPAFAKNFEMQLHEASIVDSTAVISATDFGRLVLEYAQHLDLVNFLNSTILQNATKSIFTATYAVMCTTFLIQVAPDADLTGILSVPMRRLLVLEPVAYTLIGILCTVALYIILIIFYVRMHKSMLYEKPVGLLGAAVLLCESDVLQDVAGARETTLSGEARAAIEKDQDWKAKGWKVEGREKPPTVRIVKTDLAESPKWRSSLRRNFQP